MKRFAFVVVVFVIAILWLTNLSVAQEIIEKEIIVLPNTITKTKLLIRDDFGKGKVFDVNCISELKVICPKNIEIRAKNLTELNLTIYSKKVGNYDLKITIGNKTHELEIKVTNLPKYLKETIEYYENLIDALKRENYTIVGTEKLNETKELWELGFYSEAARKLEEFTNSYRIEKKILEKREEQNIPSTFELDEKINLLLISLPFLVSIIFLLVFFKIYHKKVGFKSVFLRDLEKIGNIVRRKEELPHIPTNLPEDKRKLVEKYLKEGKYELAKILLKDFLKSENK